MTDERADKLMVGNLLGHYRIVKKIGEGGKFTINLINDNPG